MPYFMSVVPTADVATSATANTSVDHLRALTVGKDAFLTSLALIGKGQAQTSITGIEVRISRFTTASTLGAAITPNPRDPNSPAAITTFFTGPTVGATEKIQWAGGMMSSGQGGFIPVNPDDDAIALANGGGANGNADMLSQTEGTLALNYKYTLGFLER